MTRRFQFSLRALLLAAVTIGALTGFFFARRENQQLRVQVEKLNDELGTLSIGDPEKAWARAGPIKPYDTAPMRFRIYVPRAGRYRIGIQTRDVVPGKPNANEAILETLDVGDKEEFTIEVMLVSEFEGDGKFDVSVSRTDIAKNLQFVRSFNWKKAGFGAHHVGAETNLKKSTQIDLSKPVILVTVKTFKMTSQTAGGITYSGTDDPGPGFMLWIEEEPKKP